MRVAVIGTGLIGASVALAARRAGLADVRGWDADAGMLATAADRGAVAPAASAEAAAADSDLVVVAVPVALLSDAAEAALAAAPEATVTDVGSTRRHSRGPSPIRASSVAIPLPGRKSVDRRARARISSTARRGS